MTEMGNSNQEEEIIPQDIEEPNNVDQPEVSMPDELLTEIRGLRAQVNSLDSWRNGFVTCGRIMIGVFAILIATLGFATVFQFINSSIDTRVEERVSQEVAAQVGELESRLQHVDELATQMEGYVRRAEIAAAVAESSNPEPMVSLADLFAEPEATWTIIIASEKVLEDAQNVAEIATQKGYTAAIYKVGEYYTATVGRYRFKQEAENNLPEIWAEIESSAYPINLA